MQEMTGVRDQWSVGLSYEDFMGRWSRRLATEFISWLRIPRGVHWLDAGCGTGALADAVCSHADPASVVCCDPVPPFVEYARGHSRDARQSFMIAGVDSLPHRFRRVRQRYLLARFELLAGPRRRGSRNAVRGCASVHGVRVRVMDYSDGMLLLHHFWDAAVSQDSAASALAEGNRFPLCRPDALTALFRDGGLGGVRCEPIEIRTVFVSFDDYWRPFLLGTGPTPSYVALLAPTVARTYRGSLKRRCNEDQMERSFSPREPG